MKACGIVVEYNPFHNGHKYHIEMAKKVSGCDILIAVMSGNFVQRGEPAIIDKWQRSKESILNGVDLVLELPYIYATQAASQFAKGALDVLKLANVSSICFGSESNNLEELTTIASTSINPDNLKEALSMGYSFAKSYGLLSKDMQPNDILAIAYLKQILNTNIKAYPIQRSNHYYDIEIGDISSAFSIREALKTKKDLKNSTSMKEALNQGKLVFLSDYYDYIRLLLLTSKKENLSQIFLFSEGIENHLIKQILISKNFDDFINKATSRRYTSSRIKRSLIHLLNRVTKEDVKKLEPLDTIRVLAMNDKGRSYLKTLKNTKVASRFSKVQDGYREMELKALHTYSIFLDEKNRRDLYEKEIGGLTYIKL